MDPHAAPSSFLLTLLPLLALGFNLTLALSLAVGYRACGGARLEAYGRLGRGLAGAGLALAIGVVTLLVFSLASPLAGLPGDGWWQAGWLRAVPVDALAAAVLGLALYDRVMALGALAAGTLVALIWLGLAVWTLPLLFLPAIWLITARRLPVALPPAATRLLFSYGAAALLPALPLLIIGSRRAIQDGPGAGLGLVLLALLHVPAVLAVAALLRLEDRRAEEAARVRQRGDIASLPVIGQPTILARPAFDQDSSAGTLGGGNVLDRAGFVVGSSGAAALQRSIADLPEGIAIFDAEDQLVAVNLVYFHLHTELATELRPGAHYADLTRLDVLRNGLTAEGVTGDPLRGRPPAAPRSRELPFAIEDRHADKPGPVDRTAETDSGADAAASPAADPEALITALLERHHHLPWRQEIRRPNGQWLRIIESKSADGGTLRIVSDITAVKARELRLTELAERNAVLATAIASVSSGIIICDAQQPDLPITFANAAFCRISGYALDEVMGRNCRFLQGRDTDPAAVEKLRRGLEQKRPVQAVLRNYRKDGKTFWNDLHISPVSEIDGSVRHFIGIINDVTSRMRTEESLREAKNQAELANRSKTEFLANISHELRTPLNAIIGFSEVMKLGLFGPLGAQQYGGYVTDIHDSGQLLLSLINDLLDLSKIEAGRYTLSEERCSLDGLIDSAMRLVRDRAAAGKLKLRSRIDPATPDLWADRRAALQIIANLLTNAVKFTPKGGKVKVSVAPTPVHAGQRAFVAITVSDTGIGIAAADIPKVLSSFGQVDNAMSRQHEGTGLGLPIVKALVELHGGRLSIDSALGEGTSVTVTLPAVADAVVQPMLL
ncbi:MAG TPA: ATP-binding protein [Dongiaceae bacterium]|nr:ATP-binding protein [Dongiaceae bacterium]